MTGPGANESIPQAILINSTWEEAAALFEQSARVGKATPELHYLLALCHKRDGKIAEARTALRKITPPDSNVLLQLGLLSYREGQFAQAEEEFAQSLAKDPESFAASFNLLLCRLQLGQIDGCLDILPQVSARASSPEDQRLLALIDQLLRSHQGSAPAAGNLPPLPQRNGETAPVSSWSPGTDRAAPKDAAAPTAAASLLSTMTVEEERRLLDLLQGLDPSEAAYGLIQTLSAWRPGSPDVQRACLETALVQAKRHADRYQWEDADRLLTPLARLAEATLPGLSAGDPVRIALLNLKGVCACMLQDFDRAIRDFSAALRLAGNKAYLYQNLALAYEFKGRHDQAEAHWTRYFDLLDPRGQPSAATGYLEALTYAGLCRLAELYSKQDRLNSAVSFLQRAHRLRPRDSETLEKLFQLYLQARRHDDARRVLQQLRTLRPQDPQMDLFELDLIEVRSLEDLDHIISEIKRILGKHPGDGRVEDRAMHTVANCVPLIGRKSDQLSEQLAHIVEQVRRLPNYQINWPVVHDEMRHLRFEFQKLRKLATKCLSLVHHDEQRRMIRDLLAHIDSKIDVCVSMGG